MLLRYRKLKAPQNTQTRDVDEISSKTGNIYETCVFLGQRADQIAQDIQGEVNMRMNDFEMVTPVERDTDRYLDADVYEDEDQIKMSREYEQLPKPVLLALQELMNDSLQLVYVDDDGNAVSEPKQV